MNECDAFSRFIKENDAMSLEAMVVPWDTDILGFPVGQINQIKLNENVISQDLPSDFIAWREAQGLKMISYRTRHDNIKETIFLEENGFRFIEMVYPVSMNDLSNINSSETIVLENALETDLDQIQSIAREAFSTGRFNIDPRLGAEIGGRRYAMWVLNSFKNPKHQIIKATVDSQIIGFFIVELIQPDTIYWHLTAIASQFQGQGFGKRVWSGMLARHKRDGLKKVHTTISAHNSPVINLYTKLGFKFEPPMMTFHWMAS